MGCGGSKTTAVVEVNDNRHLLQETKRMKTPSISSSSSGVSSYKRSQSLQNTDRQSNQGTQHYPNQNEEEQPQQEQQSENHLQMLNLSAGYTDQPAEVKDEQTIEEQKQAENTTHQEVLSSQQQKNHVTESTDQQAAELNHIEAAGYISATDSHMVATHQTVDRQGRSFTPQEIAQHNTEVGWKEWIPHKGQVYDGNGVRAYFPSYMENREAMLEARAQHRVANGDSEEEKEFVTFMDSMLWGIPNLSDADVWQCNGITVLRHYGISEEELAKELPPFLLGTITGTSGPPYLDSVRKDVAMLLDDLSSDKIELTPGEQEYLLVLKRWQDKYGTIDPPESPPPSDGTDPNDKDFPLPVDPDSLRLYLLEGEFLDLEIPPGGAWESFQIEDTDLGDPHEIFAATLRVDFATEELLFDVDGEVAWELLPCDVIKEGVMTQTQEEIQALRNKRKNLHDPERMKKRREELCDYFIRVRELEPDVVRSYLQWASLLEANKTELEKLSEQ